MIRDFAHLSSQDSYALKVGQNTTPRVCLLELTFIGPRDSQCFRFRTPPRVVSRNFPRSYRAFPAGPTSLAPTPSNPPPNLISTRCRPDLDVKIKFGEKKTHKHEQICGIVPGLGGCQIMFMCFFRVIPFGGEKHINRIPPKIHGTIP